MKFGNEKVKKLLVDALRSGKWEQGWGFLNNDGKFCCLGVLSELAIENGIQVDIVNKNGVVAYDLYETWPPTSVRNWAEFENKAMISTLAQKNDAGFSFAEIADFIEENY